MIRSPDAIPYRWTRQYADNVVKAAIQRASIRHKVSELWMQDVGQATSGLMRCRWFRNTH